MPTQDITEFDKRAFKRNNSHFDSSITWKRFFPTLYLFKSSLHFSSLSSSLSISLCFSTEIFPDKDLLLQPSSHLVTNYSTRYKLGQAFPSLVFLFAYSCYFYPVIPFRMLFFFMIHQVCKVTFKFFEKTNV